MNLIKEVAKLAREWCASYINGGCVFYPHGESTCLYERNDETITHRCKYYETSVLPGDKKLESAYNNEINNESDSAIHYCERCGNAYERNSNSQKYCKPCSTIKERDNRRKRDRRYRERKRRIEASG